MFGLLSSSVSHPGAASHGQLSDPQCSGLREGTLYAYHTYTFDSAEKPPKTVETPAFSGPKMRGKRA